MDVVAVDLQVIHIVALGNNAGVKVFNFKAHNSNIA